MLAAVLCLAFNAILHAVHGVFHVDYRFLFSPFSEELWNAYVYAGAGLLHRKTSMDRSDRHPGPGCRGPGLGLLPRYPFR